MVRRIEDILEQVQGYNPGADLDLLRKAYVFSAREHRDQVRRSGEPYMVHPLEVAYILSHLRVDTASIVAGLLHDVVEDTLTTIENVDDAFGKDVAHIVAGVTKISKLEFATPLQAEAENLRKMILAMVDDIRVILVKLADRLHNMRTLEFLREDKQQRIAKETWDIYVPIANRLGIGRLKDELEDLSFKILERPAYSALEQALSSRRDVSDEFINDIRGELERTLGDAGIEASITGRTKSMWSIHRKMRVQRIGVDEVYDYIAFRLVTGSVKDCYGALGAVHSKWRPVPGRIKDYIAMPKPNMYQSLHTSVMTDKGQPFEVQIRTQEMHQIAEEGIAAHWQYKEGEAVDEQESERMTWLRQILEWQQDLKDPREFLDMVKIDLFPEEVYTFTPRGQVLSFATGATPIDFAYAIHTEVGDHCTGAKVNGRIVPLRYELQNGDVVEILTHPGRHPSRDWLSLAKSSRARSKIRAWLRQNERDRSVGLGRELVAREFRRYKISLHKAADTTEFEQALEALGYRNTEDFFAAVSFGKVTALSLVSQLLPEGKLQPRSDGPVSRAVRRALRRDRAILVRGMDDVMITLAKCCNPVRGEEIVGYISRGRGVSVHACNCPNVTTLMGSDRAIDVEWAAASDGESLFDVKLLVDVQDQQGLLAKIVNAVSDEKTNIKNVEALTGETSDATIKMVVAVTDRKQMDRVVKRIRGIRGVHAVKRVWR